MAYHCDVCNINFKTQKNMNSHKNTKRHKERETPNKVLYKCEKCSNSYCHRQSLYSHKKTCNFTIYDKPENTSIELMQQKMEEMKAAFDKEREELKAHINLLLDKHATNIENQTNNNNITIHINAFGHENLDYITDKMIIRCIDRVYQSIPCLIEKIHFDPNHPENHNIKITNKKLPYASIMGDNQQWKYIERNKAIESMVDKSYHILGDTYQENIDEIPDTKRRQFERFQEKFDSEDKEVIKQLKSDVELMVLNGVNRI